MVAREPASPPANSHSIGIEVADGATRITVLLSGASLSARRWHTRLAAPPSPEEAVSHIHGLIERALREETGHDALTSQLPPVIAAIGVALWGRVDTAQGIVRELRPLDDWRGFPLAARISERWHVPVTLVSATAAAALAEARHGAGAGLGMQLYVHSGRTVSLACIREDTIVLGARDGEGLLAHMCVSSGGPRCSCGLHGHLEPIASAQAIVRTMIGLASDSDESTTAMLRISQGRAEAMSSAQVLRLAAEGEPTAAGVVRQALDALALALANTVALLAPDAIVIGGPLTEAGDLFLAPLRTQLDRLCAPFTTPPVLRLGTLEPFAALLGAHLLAQPWHNT